MSLLFSYRQSVCGRVVGTQNGTTRKSQLWNDVALSSSKVLVYAIRRDWTQSQIMESFTKTVSLPLRLLTPKKNF
jgi:hypothetical protein